MTREDERVCVVGLQGSGKTTWTKAYIRAHIALGHKVLVFDPNHEYSDCTGATVYQSRRGGSADALRAELENLLQTKIIQPYKLTGAQPYRLLVLDEASRYIEHAKPLGEAMRWINDTMRHMRLSMVTISRRFVQQNVDMAELAHRLIIYRQTGINDLKRLGELSRGLDEAMLNLEKYHYIEVKEDRTYEIMPPVQVKK